MRVTGIACRRTDREEEAFPVADYEEDQPSRHAYSLPVGGWANENLIRVLALFLYCRKMTGYECICGKEENNTQKIVLRYGIIREADF